MRASEIRDLTTDEIVARLADEQDRLLRLRLNHAVSAIENPSDIRSARRTIARLQTILTERRKEETVTS
ncbi:MAG: 50S ribosomal protein L29 [Bacteroidota bacterium]